MKSLIVTLFIASTVAAEELFCTPGSLFQQSCNSCVCSKDGKSAACTDMVCPEANAQKYCEPGKQFQMDDLSTCICNKDGMTAACTLGLQIYGRSRHLKKNSEYCTPRSSFSPDNCNTCVCSEDGSNALCTLQMCPVEEPKQVCEPRKSFRDYCNTCFCDDNGSTYSCTRMYCDKNIWNKDGSMKVEVQRSAEEQVCEPRKSFNDYCNKCFCSDDGLSAVCTRMWCDKDIWNPDGTFKGQFTANVRQAQKKVCEPQKSFKDYCNTCFCDDDGLSYSCTRMFCDKDIWNKDGSMKVKNPQSATKQACEPSKAFNDYCNTCICSKDGTSFACTEMYCDKDMWNKDGTSKMVVKNAEARVCTPNSQFKEQCNTCVCSEDGLSKVCTLMVCDALDSEPKREVCKPRSTFSPDGCNTCKCNDFGTDYVCTFEICPESLGNSRTVSKSSNWGVLYKQGDLCTPGQAFYSECNRCVCTADGRNAFCTLMDCHNTV